jgi:hypothetical protein
VRGRRVEGAASTERASRALWYAEAAFAATVVGTRATIRACTLMACVEFDAGLWTDLDALAVVPCLTRRRHANVSKGLSFSGISACFSHAEAAPGQ